MQSADFDKLTDSRPINKLAYIVAQSNGIDNGVCQHSCHPYLNQATKTSVALT